MLGRILLAGAILLGGIAELQARTYYLPDYQSSFVYGGRTQKVDSTPQVSRTCSTFGYYSAADRPEYSDCKLVNAPIPGLVCYSCTACPSTYTYDSSNCSGEYVVSGESCGGRYTNCICDPSQYPGNSAGNGCAEGEKADLSQSCTNKSGGETFYKCVDDPCYDLISESTCSSSGKYCRTSPSCSGKCESCDVDTCSWAENLGYAECDNGCDTNGSIEGCPGRCKTGCKQITCPRGQKPDGDVCVEMNCNEKLAADGYAVVTNCGEYMSAMGNKQHAVIMGGFGKYSKDPETGEMCIYSSSGTSEATASLYTTSYIKGLDSSYYSDCPTTSNISIYVSRVSDGVDIYPNVSNPELYVRGNVSFYGDVIGSIIMLEPGTVNIYGRHETTDNSYLTYTGGKIDGTLNLYGPTKAYAGIGGSNAIINIYDDFVYDLKYSEASSVRGETINFHNPEKQNILRGISGNVNVDSGVLLQKHKPHSWDLANGTIKLASGACIQERDRYKVCAQTPVTITAQNEMFPLSCLETGTTETGSWYDEIEGSTFNYTVSCKGTITTNCPEGTTPVRLSSETANDEKLYGFIQSDGSIIYCPYMYTPTKPGGTGILSTLVEKDGCYSARNNDTQELENGGFTGVVCVKEAMTCEKQIMSKYPQAMIIKSEADLDKMMTEEKLSELSTNNQPAVLVNDIILSKSQTWKGYGSVKFVGATYFSDISECAEMEMPTVNLNGNTVKLGSELNMYNIHISGNSPSTDTITQIESYDMSFQDGKMSDISLKGEDCRSLDTSYWLKNVEMSNVDMYRIYGWLYTYPDGGDSYSESISKETMNEFVNEDSICFLSYDSSSSNCAATYYNTGGCGYNESEYQYIVSGVCELDDNGTIREFPLSMGGSSCHAAEDNAGLACREYCQ